MSRAELAALLEGSPPPRRRGRPPKRARPVLDHQVVVARYLWPTVLEELVAHRAPFESRIASDGRSVALLTTATVAERLRSWSATGEEGLA